jgi:Flp pilus assembly pilin Flp
MMCDALYMMKGAGLVELGLRLALAAVGLMAVVTLFGGSLSRLFE